MNRRCAVYILAAETALLVFCSFVLCSVVWVARQKPVPKIERTQVVEIQYVKPVETKAEQEAEKTKYAANLFNTGYVVKKNRPPSINSTDIDEGADTFNFAEADVAFRFSKIDSSKLPVSYTEVNYPYIDYPLYVFIDSNGSTQYRAFVIRKAKNGSVEEGFIPVEQKMKNMKMTVRYNEDTAFVDPDQEPYGIIEQVDADNDKVNGLIKEFGMTGVYYRTDDKGEKEYFVYGHYQGRENSFFLADNNGEMIPGTLPLANMWQEAN